MGQSGFSKTRRAVQKHVIDRLVSLHGRFDGNFQSLDHVLLPDHFVHASGPQRTVAAAKEQKTTLRLGQLHDGVDDLVE